MLELKQVRLQRGPKVLLENCDLNVYDGQSVGVIGPNGSGKSSLFALLNGVLECDSGDVSSLDNYRLSHMAQEVVASSRPARAYVIDGDSKLRDIQQKLELAEAADDHYQITTLHAEIDHLDGYTAERRAEALLRGLGFAHDECELPVDSFSGGWRIRLNLAQALMCPSDLLLLDEPTNHLDLDTTLWLQTWLAQYRGTLLMISHDRDFIDAVCDTIVAVEHKQLRSYRGNYSAYETQRAERLAQEQATYDRQQRRVAEIDAFVRRFRYKATKAKQAQSRLKELERMELIAPAHVDSPFHFSFVPADRVSDPMLTLSEASLGYAGKAIVNKVNLALRPGSRVALLGANGAGKSTLLKGLAGEMDLLEGDRIVGAHCSIGYYNQHQLEALDLDASALLHLQRLRPDAREQQIRDFLGGFNFHGDTATGSIKHFSGGEKARLALAIIVWQKPSLLILDEPTNHLDLEMRQALTEAIQGYEGALVLVSHDRYLLRNSVDTLLLVEGGQAEEYTEDLATYERWLLARDPDSDTPTPTAPRSDESRQDKRRNTAKRRSELQPLRQAIRNNESSMEKLTLSITEVETALADASLYDAGSSEQLQELLIQQSKLAGKRTRLEEEWLALQETLEALQDSP